MVPKCVFVLLVLTSSFNVEGCFPFRRPTRFSLINRIDPLANNGNLNTVDRVDVDVLWYQKGCPNDTLQHFYTLTLNQKYEIKSPAACPARQPVCFINGKMRRINGFVEYTEECEQCFLSITGQPDYLPTFEIKMNQNGSGCIVVSAGQYNICQYQVSKLYCLNYY